MQWTGPEKWFRKIYPNPETGCWEWHGSTNMKYGRVRVNKKLRPVHRVIWEFATGKMLPSELDLDHLCGNILCVNPSHLEPVTRKENRQRQAERQGKRRRS